MTKKTATMNVVNDEPQRNEEIIKRTPLETTPFTMIEYGGKHFGTFGQYKITEDYKNQEEVKTELLKMNWNRVIQCMTLVHEMLTKNNK